MTIMAFAHIMFSPHLKSKVRPHQVVGPSMSVWLHDNNLRLEPLELSEES